MADHVKSDVQHALHHPVRDGGQIDVRPDVPTPSSRAQSLLHRGGDLRRPALGQFDQFRICAGPLVEGHLQGGSMLDRASSDGAPEAGDLLVGRPRIGLVQLCQCLFADPVEVGVVAADQLDEDRLLGFEMVVKAAREDARGVRNLLQRRAQSGRRYDSICGLEDLGAAGGFLAFVRAGATRGREPLRPGRAGHLSHRLLSR